MIDKRELLERARQRDLNLQIVEKDYVLGWLLFGLRGFNDLAFKGGTALAKVYFPQTWRLSEDLDFAFQGENFEVIPENLGDVFSELREKSGIKFDLKSRFANPIYLQLKIRFEKKRKLNTVEFVGTRQFFPANIFDILQPYWESELGRLLNPLPDLNDVLAELKDKVGFLEP